MRQAEREAVTITKHIRQFLMNLEMKALRSDSLPSCLIKWPSRTSSRIWLRTAWSGSFFFLKGHRISAAPSSHVLKACSESSPPFFEFFLLLQLHLGVEPERLKSLPKIYNF